MLEFERLRIPNIIVGDSRSRVLSSSVLEDMGCGEWYNFSYGGGSLDEALDTMRLQPNTQNSKRS